MFIDQVMQLADLVHRGDQVYPRAGPLGPADVRVVVVSAGGDRHLVQVVGLGVDEHAEVYGLFLPEAVPRISRLWQRATDAGLRVACNPVVAGPTWSMLLLAPAWPGSTAEVRELWELVERLARESGFATAGAGPDWKEEL